MTGSNHESVEIHYRGVPIRFSIPSKEDHISKTIASSGTFYECDMLESIAEELRPGDMVIDAGANIGNHTIYFSKVAGCRVHAFEAYPATAALLRANVKENEVRELVTVHSVALGSTTGTASVENFDAGNVGGTSFTMSSSGKIEVLALDNIEDFKQVRLIKIDVEGMELAVLRGAKELLTRDRPLVVCEAATASAYAAVRKFMQELGYLPVAVYNATDTYLFMPTKSSAELKDAIRRCFAQLMSMQRTDRYLADRQAQAGRYSERLQREALAEMRKSVADLREESLADLGSAGSLWDQLEQIREDWVRLSHATRKEVEASKKDWDLERKTIEAEVSALRQAQDAYRSEITEYQQQVSSLLQLLSDARFAAKKLQADLEKSAADHVEKLDALRDQLESSEAEKLDKERRVRDAHRVLRLRNSEIDSQKKELAHVEKMVRELRIRNSEIQGETTVIQSSLTFRIGSLVVASLRSPFRLILLPLSIPVLLFKEWKARRP